jgi:hypothetical protein
MGLLDDFSEIAVLHELNHMLPIQPICRRCLQQCRDHCGRHSRRHLLHTTPSPITSINCSTQDPRFHVKSNCFPIASHSSCLLNIVLRCFLRKSLLGFSYLHVGIHASAKLTQRFLQVVSGVFSTNVRLRAGQVSCRCYCAH